LGGGWLSGGRARRPARPQLLKQSPLAASG
jgi:hypothetical protein